MKQRSFEYLQSLTQNNRTVLQNVENGIKAWFTRQQRMIERAEQNGINVRGLIREYCNAIEVYDNDYSIQGIIYKEITYIQEEGFCRFGDRNWITKEIRRNHLRSDGRHIDDLAEELSNTYNREITPSDIAEFIKDYPEKKHELFVKIEEIQEVFKELIGFRIDRRFMQNYNEVDAPVELNCPL